MANKKQVALIASALSFLPADMLANAQEIQICDPNRKLTKCEKGLYDAATVWEGRAEETRESLNGCLDKLAVRTSTVVNKIVVAPKIEPKEDTFSKNDLLLYTGMGMLGFILGTLVTAALR
tara:strand:- start:148 stop:510 length:363 start_codon:yes stop_codon:yes gene_type:complete